MRAPLAVIEDIIDASGAAEAIEDMLPHGARGRQLTARTLLTGMMLTVADGRPAHLTRVHAALASLPRADPRPPGDTATPTCPAPKARCSSATTSARQP